MQRAAFDNSTFTVERWCTMAAAPPYRHARCLVATGGTGDPAALRLLFDAQAVVPVTLAIAFFTAATAVGALSTGILPRWVGSTGLAAALILLVGAAAQAHLVTGSLFAPKGRQRSSGRQCSWAGP